MDQELKQRLIGAAVITALAAIFVPMLFDDPIDQSGKNVNELTIPKLPNKAQDVEIMPLPEKVEDVATRKPIKQPEPPAYVNEEAAETGGSFPLPESAIEPDGAGAMWPDDSGPELVEEDAGVQIPAGGNTTEKPAPLPDDVDKKEAGKPFRTELENATVRWYLNVGSFSRKENAVNMMENLRKQGFSVSIKDVNGKDGTIHKVRVGPILDKAKAQEVKNRLSQINVNSFVAGED